MTTITLKVPDNKSESMISYLSEFPFAKIQSISKEKARILNGIKKGLQEVQLIQQGKLESISLEEMYSELENERNY